MVRFLKILVLISPLFLPGTPDYTATKSGSIFATTKTTTSPARQLIDGRQVTCSSKQTTKRSNRKSHKNQRQIDNSHRNTNNCHTQTNFTLTQTNSQTEPTDFHTQTKNRPIFTIHNLKDTSDIIMEDIFMHENNNVFDNTGNNNNNNDNNNDNSYNNNSSINNNHKNSNTTTNTTNLQTCTNDETDTSGENFDVAPGNNYGNTTDSICNQPQSQQTICQDVQTPSPLFDRNSTNVTTHLTLFTSSRDAKGPPEDPCDTLCSTPNQPMNTQQTVAETATNSLCDTPLASIYDTVISSICDSSVTSICDSEEVICCTEEHHDENDGDHQLDFAVRITGVAPSDTLSRPGRS